MEKLNILTWMGWLGHKIFQENCKSKESILKDTRGGNCLYD